jgi:hypothetical protein
VPAQASPLLATVTTAVLLDWKETGSAIVCRLLLWAVAVKDRMAPTSMDTVLAGERLIVAGTGKGTDLVALLPQPSKAAVQTRRIIADSTEPDLPMHPPRLMVAHGASMPTGKFPV